MIINFKIYENKITIMNIFAQIKNNNYEFVEQSLKDNRFDINSTVGHSIKVPLISAINDIDMLELLTKYDVDWYKKDANGNDFIDRLENGSAEHQIKLLKYIKWKYPDRYNEHIVRKETNKYNL